MGILGWLIFGLIVGLLARAVKPGRDPMGLLATAVLGMLGALLAGWFGTAVGWYERDSGIGMLAAIVGAVLVLSVYNAVRRPKIAASSTSTDKVDKDRYAA